MASDTLPAHYQIAGRNYIYAIEETLGPEGFRAFCMGNWMKYNARHKLKGGEGDLKKAAQYLEWAANGLPRLEPEDEMPAVIKFKLGDIVSVTEMPISRWEITSYDLSRRQYGIRKLAKDHLGNYTHTSEFRDLPFCNQHLWSIVGPEGPANE